MPKKITQQQEPAARQNKLSKILSKLAFTLDEKRSKKGGAPK